MIFCTIELRYPENIKLSYAWLPFYVRLRTYWTTLVLKLWHKTLNCLHILYHHMVSVAMELWLQWKTCTSHPEIGWDQRDHVFLEKIWVENVKRNTVADLPWTLYLGFGCIQGWYGIDQWVTVHLVGFHKWTSHTVFWKYLMKKLNWLGDLDSESEEMMPPKVQRLSISTLEFNWDSPNLYKAFKLFKEQVIYLLIEGPWKNLEDYGRIGIFFNWLCPKSYAVLKNLVFSVILSL